MVWNSFCTVDENIMKWELWHSLEGHQYSLFSEENVSNRKLLEPDAELILIIEAETQDEAAQQMHEFLGWEKYKPMED